MSDNSASAVNPEAKNSCPNCKFINRPGVLTCEQCGALLITGADVGLKTRNFRTEDSGVPLVSPVTMPAQLERPMTDTQEMLARSMAIAGTDTFNEDMFMRLTIDGAEAPLIVTPEAETLIGRRDPATGTMPQIDLSPYSGYRMGVSRRHALILRRPEHLEIVDLGSSNGSALNGTPLDPHTGYRLRDGDQLILGKMAIRVGYQIQKRRKHK